MEATLISTLSSTAASWLLPRPGLRPVRLLHCPFLISFVFRSHPITINARWVPVTHPNMALLEVQEPAPASPRLCLLSQVPSPSSPSAAEDKIPLMHPTLGSSLYMVVEVLSTNSIQILVTTPPEKDSEVKAFSTFLSCYAWEPRRLAFSTPVSLGLGAGGLNLAW